MTPRERAEAVLAEASEPRRVSHAVTIAELYGADLARDLIAAEDREARMARALLDGVVLTHHSTVWTATLPDEVSVRNGPCGSGDTWLAAICDLYAALDAATEVERG